jgi:hypothetical protein
MNGKINNLKDQQNNKPIGARVNTELWDSVKIQAIKEHRKTGDILDDAIRLYLKTNNSDET